MELNKIAVGLKLSNVSQSTSKALIDDSDAINFNIYFEHLSKEGAKNIIWFNDEKIGDAIIKFDKVTVEQANHII
jgi:hypothetical protein